MIHVQYSDDYPYKLYYGILAIKFISIVPYTIDIKRLKGFLSGTSGIHEPTTYFILEVSILYIISTF